MLTRFITAGVVCILLVWPNAVHADTRTVTLSVPGMTCAACPITVKRALQRVEGVEKVAVAYESKEAVITFDEAKTSVDRLRAATANAGYPSTLKQSR